MKLFHYHYWTNHVEETENFYVQQGFRIVGRFANTKAGMKLYHPPLTWDDFRNENPQFRIIEMRRGKVNVTFGAGKKPMFDHIGYLVTKEEHENICNLATQLGWKVNTGERRTFIGTPSRLRIELQQRNEVVEDERDQILSMDITVKDLGDVKDFSQLLGENASELHFILGEHLALNKVILAGEKNHSNTDPNGVAIEVVNLKRG